jgi:hypothetical protein
MTAGSPRAPAGLGLNGRRLWRETVLNYEVDPHERPALAEACHLADELAALRAQLAADGRAFVRGSAGQEVANPLYGEIRAHAGLIHRLLVSLGVEDAPGEARARSRSARKAATARWSR